jgi:small subunit ribosomal protein S2
MGTVLSLDSLRCIQLIAGVLGRAGEAGQQKRLEAAKTGEVTWLPPPGLGRPVTDEDRRKAAEVKRAKKKEKKSEKDDKDVYKGPLPPPPPEGFKSRRPGKLNPAVFEDEP